MCFGGTLTWPSRFIDSTDAGRLCVSFASEPAGWVLAFDRMRTDLYIGGTDFELKVRVLICSNI